MKKLLKPKYITTPIYYVNAAPHLGHLYSSVLAETARKWYEFQGYPTMLSTGTDEHGTKVAQAAQLAKMQPKEYCDKTSQQFRELADFARVKYTDFIRTTSPDHIQTVSRLWQKIADNGYIYKGSHKGWYCIGDEAYYAEHEVEEVADPKTNTKFVQSKISKKPVEWYEEDNYFFKLSAFRTKLIDLIEKNELKIYPETVQQSILRELSLGTEDLSVSRPVSRVDWAIPVPNDPSQTMYVWIDALANYLVPARYPWSSAEEMTANGWPPDMHIIGKDIQRFHCIYWPAFLLAANIPLPKSIIVHSHWTVDGVKMSKSIGNVVDPFLLIQRFTRPPVNLFLLGDSNLENDGDYSDEKLLLRYEIQLRRKYGNLVSRLQSKSFNIPNAVKQHFSSNQEDILLKPEYASVFSNGFISEIDTLRDRVEESMEMLNTAKALREIWLIISASNKYIDDCAPWAFKGSEESQIVQNEIIFRAVEAVRVSTLLLQVFIPEIPSNVLDSLGVHPDRRSFEYAAYGADPTYGTLDVRKHQHPVPRLQEADLL
ncbi:hypothetical protein CANCADRAFT_30190 [Tortispora caseinolytica NRRL Y-17796]|uniref:Probable methionine--tRNA ligase, mitochondrial n=1 Tax=Tortispora caseinolytica NRRL Y-17796 TaxID=767744 RepID=A0A1E4TJP3_9ASCO|nr:hypothetical protein CANCADRAFT_30190 [Tortispora caseinolytica NRRL Y-17796]